MKFSERLYESVKEIWQSYYEHPFVKGIGDGTLEVDKFKYYMIQDYLYLLDYAKIYALGIVKADTEEVMQGFSSMVNGILNGEMSIHRSYMKRLGISQEEIKDAKASLDNISYTHYMLAVSHTGNLADLTVSLLSCMWSYLEIGRNLSKVPNSTEHEFYGEWIRGYISKEYEELTQWVIDLTDELARDMSEKELKKLEEIFINTSKYEYMFWEMSYNKGM
ncbi:thiaminase/transcriptional activator TenA [Clostridium tetanomorphum]|uniref:Aminopyrimidine aminohydrolase n=1 Tax=Clostridium tetanomorphum TaxID=1553 RepID=A0A923J004_CLOTT|nr:thiaminase II [Clostridium tetanomorphum]KAJ49675.1 Thiaminase II [Clostridium tetanomorphum DSM 665]KAJ49898.1 Thiaminase II [Clostridium tetanomorphum DSM 665]MBC2397826.1 thiaminase II [Clostridium tetanomorphum]MBP1864571.1 thiaminase/transcriptional activator TenA [Clostridium tetanomorphum]NRS84040.1 thiaminase/transcriptional activator TenA [Clostridium tetanomorphum]